MKSYAEGGGGRGALLPQASQRLPAGPRMPSLRYGGELVLTGQLDKTMFPGRNTDAGGMDVYLNACENLVEMTADRTINPCSQRAGRCRHDLKTITFQLNEGINSTTARPSTRRPWPSCSMRRWPRNSCT